MHRCRPALFVLATLAACASVVVVDNASPAFAATPRPAPSPISAGVQHALALTSAGTVRAWGVDDSGQLGDGQKSLGALEPVTVRGPGGVGSLTGIVAVSAGDGFSVALREDGTVWAWGANGAGSLGDGTLTDRLTPVEVVAASGSGHLSGIVAVSAGDESVVAIRSDGTAWAWGQGDAGQLGNGATTSSDRPVEVLGVGDVGHLGSVVAVAAGESHVLGLLSSGTVVAWGKNQNGQLGDGTTTDRLVPVKVDLSGGAVAIAAGEASSMALRSDGSVATWGRGTHGELGNGLGTDSVVPTQPYELGGSVVGVAMGGQHALAVKADGTVLAWGANGTGQLGIGTASSTPQLIPARVTGLGYGSGVVQVAAGANDSLARTSSGAVYSWGLNTNGQLGDTTTLDSAAPVRTDGLPKIADPPLTMRVRPRISGTARRGHTLSVSKGTWGLPATSWTYRWLRNGVPIAGATKSTHKVVTADRRHRLSVRVTASRAGYPAASVVTASVRVPS